MNKWLRRTLYYLFALFGVMVVYAALYQAGMRAFEGESFSYLHSLQIVVETFTTTGFGSDAPWRSPEMNLFVIVMDLSGVVLIFLALPVLVFPLLEDAFSTSVPRAVENGLEDHVVICTYTSRAEAVIAELERRGVDYVLVEPDRDRAADLYDDEYQVIHADPESIEGLEDAHLPTARAVVADVSDRIDASIVLAAKEVAEDVPVVSVVEEPSQARYHDLAGADEVLSPRPILGRSLASKVTPTVSTNLGDAIEIGDDLEIAELPLQRGSRLVGTTLAESDALERSGVNVIGAWFDGEFESPPSPDAEFGDGTVLLVTGRESQLQTLTERVRSDLRWFGDGEVVILGYGQVGRTVAGALETEGIEYTTVDADQFDGVDVVGDAADPDTLREAGVDEARSAVLALPEDTTAEFATLVLRELNPDIEIVARVQGSGSIQKMYRAGADYVLSLATVSGRMIASHVMEDETVLSLDRQIEVVKTAAPGLVGDRIGDAEIRSHTGCTVVGVERDGEVHTDVGPEFRIHRDDELIVAGTDDGIREFSDLAE